jgi:hypothetical protein
MRKPWIATIEQVKLFLQIDGTEYDALIATYLPVVSHDIEKITNNEYIVAVTGDLTTGSKNITDVDTEMIDYGNVVMTQDIEQVAVIEIDEDNELFTVAVEAAQDLTGTDILVNVFPTSKKPVAAAMVMYNIKRYTEVIDFNGPLKSERVGNYTWTGDGGTSAGYPQWMIDALAEITMPRFI